VLEIDDVLLAALDAVAEVKSVREVRVEVSRR